MGHYTTEKVQGSHETGPTVLEGKAKTACGGKETKGQARELVIRAKLCVVENGGDWTRSNFVSAVEVCIFLLLVR